ncbi:diacylglycerol kinase family protein [Prosthecobacter sp.]|uniref:diacylglycerol kinase family protein n=1 Tax=Prosthecobacter sp. TaxID=1965333 RepID=UPI003783EAF9
MFRWLAGVLRSFGPALAGLAWALKTQGNLRAHVLAAVLAGGCGLWLQIAAWEWCAVLLAVGLVFAAELLNTALEVLADRVSKEREEPIRRTKDAAAAAVLMAALAALGVGLVVFLPKLWRLL